MTISDGKSRPGYIRYNTQESEVEVKRAREVGEFMDFIQNGNGRSEHNLSNIIHGQRSERLTSELNARSTERNRRNNVREVEILDDDGVIIAIQPPQINICRQHQQQQQQQRLTPQQQSQLPTHNLQQQQNRYQQHSLHQQRRFLLQQLISQLPQQNIQLHQQQQQQQRPRLVPVSSEDSPEASEDEQDNDSGDSETDIELSEDEELDDISEEDELDDISEEDDDDIVVDSGSDM